MNKYTFLLSGFLLFFFVDSYSGETNDYTYKYFQLGSGVCQVQNTHLSPLAYQGSGLNLQAGGCRGWGQQLRSSALILDFNYYNNANKVSSLSGASLVYNYFRYYKLEAQLPGSTQLFVGGGYSGVLEVLNSPVNINNSVFYSFNNSLNIAFFLAKKWGDYFFSNEFSIPIIGLYSTSEYASSFPYILYHDDVDFLSHSHVGSLNLNSMLRNSFNFDVVAHTKRKAYTLRFNYTIVYGRQEINNISYTKAFHQLGVGVLFNTKHHDY